MNVNGVFHNNVFHMVLFYHHIKLCLKVLFINLVLIHAIIAIDDVFIRDRACLEPGDCDFENG